MGRACWRCVRGAPPQSENMRALRPCTPGIAARIASGFSGGELESLFTAAGLGLYVSPGKWNKAGWSARTVTAAQRDADDGEGEAIEGLHEFVRLVAERLALSGTEGNGSWARLREALRADGYDPRVEEDGRVRLLPMDEPHAPLSVEITALEDDFRQLDMTVACNHYRQAVDILMREHYESANGALRSMIEAVVCRIAELEGRPWVRQGEGQSALQYLIDEKKVLPKGDGGNFVRGLWEIIQTDGPHPGTTTAGEAQFRFQAGTACARYLIDRFTRAEA